MKTNSATDLSAATLADLAAIPGDTYSVKNELKALGAVWDKTERVWRIAESKLAQARALVEHQALSPTAATSANGGGGIDLDTLVDPFEDEGDGPRYTMLSEQDGDVYAAKDALKAIGASWDKGSRAWKVREERAEYARAIVASVSGDPAEAVSAAPATKPKPTPARKPASAPAVPAVDVGRTPPIPNEPAEENQAKPIPSSAKIEGEADNEKPVENPPLPSGMVLGGLWRRRGADGKVYLSGWLSDTVEIRIVSNEQRTEDTDPSHLMYLLPINPLVAPEE